MTKATNDNIPIPAAAHGDQRHAPFPLDIAAISAAAADVHAIRCSISRIVLILWPAIGDLPTDELTRCRLLARDLENTIARRAGKSA